MNRIKILYAFLGLFLLNQCASGIDSSLESAQFELDQGNYDQAITLANEVLANDPGNVKAGRIAGSAYFALSGIDFFDLAENLLQLDEHSSDYFQQIANALPNTADLGDLRSAIEVLSSITGIDAEDITDEEIADAAYDLGLMMAIEHFAIGVFNSNFNTNFDVTDITDESNVEADLLSFDNRIIGAVSDDAETSYLNTIRQTWCILEPLSAGTGFTVAEYQALVGCQLGGANFNTVPFLGAGTTCNDLNPTAQAQSVENCYAQDTD